MRLPVSKRISVLRGTNMSNLEKYNKTFVEVLNVEESELNAEFSFETVGSWDSIAHMTLVSGFEDAFDIMLDTEDILNFVSYEAGKAILAKYDVEL